MGKITSGVVCVCASAGVESSPDLEASFLLAAMVAEEWADNYNSREGQLQQGETDREDEADVQKGRISVQWRAWRRAGAECVLRLESRIFF